MATAKAKAPVRELTVILKVRTDAPAKKLMSKAGWASNAAGGKHVVRVKNVTVTEDSAS